MTSNIKKKVPSNASKSRSGIKTLKAGEILFNEKDVASSLYIIQKGQIRLYLPKGRGFVEIGILRAGEVIGEMAYFDERSRRRSCSAAAIMTTEIVEVSFNAFAKTMQGLNPWFKTIINTLADRLRKTNDKVKYLENNSVGFGVDGKVGDYKFFHNIDIIKILSLFYMTFKSHGEIIDGKNQVHIDKLKFYLFDVFNIKEIVFEEFKIILEDLSFISLKNDEDDLPKIVVVSSVDIFKNLMYFFNTQRQVDDSKALRISDKCETFLEAIISQLSKQSLKSTSADANITKIMQEFEVKKILVSEEDLADSATAGFTGDLMVGEGNVVTCRVAYSKLVKAFPAIRLMNAVKRINESKSGSGHY